MIPWLGNLALILCLCNLCVRADEVVYKSNDAIRMGLRGSVYSQLLVSSTKLNTELQIVPQLFIDAPKFWAVFDSRGRIVEQSNPMVSDNVAPSIVRVNYDQGTGNRSWTDAFSRWRKEIRHTADGFLDIRTWKNGLLFLRETNQFDSEGRLAELTSYNSKGRALHRVVYRYDAEGSTTESYVLRRGGQFVLEMSSKYDLDGELVQRTAFDAGGQPVTAFSLIGGHLTSYWQKADCYCANGAEVTSDGISYTYQTNPDGKLETTVANHRLSRSAIEPEDIERYSENGSLAEKVVFDYERDSRGNWTKRTVYSEDVITGVLLPIQEDIRTIVYY